MLKGFEGMSEVCYVHHQYIKGLLKVWEKASGKVSVISAASFFPLGHKLNL